MALLSATVTNIPTKVFEVNDVGFRVKYPGSSYAITSAFFCNVSSDPTTVNVYLVPDGSTPTSGNIIFKSLNISGNDTFALDTEKIILGDGDAVWASATNTNLSIVMSIVRVA